MEIERHVRILAWLYIVHSALIMIAAVIAFIGITLGGLFSGDLGHMIGMPIVGVIVGLFVALFAIPGFIAGNGLLEGKSWARVLTMVLGALKILDFPLGTALGVYTFWVLWGDKADRIFEPIYGSYEYDRY